MVGLVVLGLLTVVAGVLSGRSTIDYVLGRDAREAALSWTADIEERLRQPGAPESLLDKKLQVLNPVAFSNVAGRPAAGIILPSGPSFREDGFSLVDGINQITRGWFLGDIEETPGEFVSKLEGFAVLTPAGQPIAVGGRPLPRFARPPFSNSRVSTPGSPSLRR